MTIPRRDRAGDKVRAEAYRLALEEKMSAAAIEAHLISVGHIDVARALAEVRGILDVVATAPRAEQAGILEMFLISTARTDAIG